MTKHAGNPPLKALFESLQAKKWGLRQTEADLRIEKLSKLRAKVLKYRAEIEAALFQDFRKPAAEAVLTEIYPTLGEIKHTQKHLKKWMESKYPKNPLTFKTSKAESRFEPKGVCLVISPWNYPFYLAMAPIIAAVSAGNAVIVKPSEMAPNTSRILSRIIAEAFPSTEVTVVEGGIEETQALLALPFDHVFFTGSTAVGRIVMKAAAEHLSTVTLELGGKSPCLIHPSAKIDQAATRIAWGKWINAGQTCVAPDYLLVHESQEEALLSALKERVTTSYGATSEKIQRSPDFARIISDKHFERLKNLYDLTIAEGGKLNFGGGFDARERYVSPTILRGITPKMTVMKEEIFGPILPVITYREVADAVTVIRQFETPLALYLFGEDANAVDQLLVDLPSGGACVNNTVLHIAHPDLPFGGQGPSGMGNYHGEYGFRTFSHERAILKQGALNATSLMTAPYNDKVKKMIDAALKWLT